MLRCRTSISSVALGALAIVLFAATDAARAVPVAPGESVFVNFEGEFTPTGTLEQDETRPVSLTYAAPTGQTFDAEGAQTTTTIDGTFRQRIFRDPATNRLAFVYTVLLDRPDLESIDLIAASFLNFTTDVDGDLGSSSQAIAVTRSADGATLTATQDQGLAQDGGSFAIFTDAENFNANGTLGVEAGAEFTTYDETGAPLGGATGIVSDAFSLDAVFQPSEQIEPPPPGVIPLPAALWPGMILLGAVALKVRRRHAV